jgi:hypothetical protein
MSNVHDGLNEALRTIARIGAGPHMSPTWGRKFVPAKVIDAKPIDEELAIRAADVSGVEDKAIAKLNDHICDAIMGKQEPPADEMDRRIAEYQDAERWDGLS